MPTGYTEDLYMGKEVTFEQFAMKCARAFGALITMREEPLDAPIPEEFEPDNYHLEELEKARQRLAEVESWSEEQAELEAEKAYQEAVRKRNGTIAKNARIRERYEKMLAQVRTWIPPTPDHEELKRFMVEQLQKSIEYDCSYVPDEPKRLSGAEYKQQQIAEARWEVEYHTKEYEEEVKRVQKRNEWLRALRESLRQHD